MKEIYQKVLGLFEDRNNPNVKIKGQIRGVCFTTIFGILLPGDQIRIITILHP